MPDGRDEALRSGMPHSAKRQMIVERNRPEDQSADVTTWVTNEGPIHSPPQPVSPSNFCVSRSTSARCRAVARAPRQAPPA
jgi:hypothetical protein